MKRYLPIGLALVVGLVAGALLFRGGGSHEGHDHSGSATDGTGTASQDEVWTCSMHPQVKAPKPGKCPICAMDLIPLSSMGTSDGERTFSMSEAAKALAGITTVEVVREHPETNVRLFGKVAYDETSMKTVAARFPARIDRLFVDYTGIPVKKDDHLAEVYSPELLAAQTELLTAKRFNNQDALQVARDKLRLWGFPEERIREIESSGKTSDLLMIDAPMSGIVTHKSVNEGDYVQTGSPFFRIAELDEVWVMLDAYESDTPWLRFGQDVAFTTESMPGKTFHGRISFISPELDSSTRTVSVRVNVPNEEGLLKPGMYVSGVVKAKVAGAGRVLDPSLAGKWISPMHPEIVKDSPGQCDICGMDLVPAEKLGYVSSTDEGEPPMVIPVSSVLHTGKRSVVYVEKPDVEQPTFDGREVLLGPRAGDKYIVEAGLKPGEKVVAEGGFVIDSALQIQAKTSMMLPGEEEGDRLFPESPAPGEFLSETDGLLKSYFAIQDSLAGDSLEKAKAAADQFAEKLQGVDDKKLAPSSAVVWEDLSGRINESVKVIRALEEIEPFRKSFQGLTLLVDEMVRRFGTVSVPVYSHYCPMAFDNKGGTWLQPNEDLLNPYFGSTMLRCGEVTEQIASPGVIELTAEETEVVSELVDGYFSLQSALANDSAENAQSAAKGMLPIVSDFARTLGQNEKASFLANSLSETLRSASEKISESDTIAQQRVSFKGLSQAMETVVSTFGGSLEATVFKAHCPMAFKNQGADWLQSGDQILNPYFGASMLNCGDIEEQLAGPEIDKR